jgi:hypothetical protein
MDRMDDFKPSKFLTLVVLGLAISWSGCGDMLPGDPPQPDAMVGNPPIGPDAGPPDAVPIDAPPPWEPPDPILPDDPCEIVSDVPEAVYDADMANYSVRFRDGQGLELSGDIRQAGLLEVENADLEKRDAVEKRLGADVLADTRTGGTSIPDADKRAIWSRYDELLLQTDKRLYSLKQVTNDGAFQWRDVGAWTQMRLREAYANKFSSPVLHADSAKLGDATVVAYGLDAGGGAQSVNFAVYGPTMTREALENLTTNGSRPRLSILNDTTVVVTYQGHAGAFPLIARTWTLGDDLPVVSYGANPFASLPAVNGVWDVHGAETNQGDEVTAWVAATPTANDFAITVRMGAVTGTSAAARGGAMADIAVAVWPRRVSGGTLIRVVSVELFPSGGIWGIIVTWFDFNPTTGVAAPIQFQSGALTDSANAGRSVSVSFSDAETVLIGVEQSGDGGDSFRKVSYFTASRPAVSPGPAPTALGIIHNYTSLVSQGAIVAGGPVDTLIAAGAEPLVPAFVEMLQPFGGNSSATERNGWVVFAPRTGEVIARSFAQFTGNLLTRQSRSVKGSLVVNGDNITWAGPASILSEPGGTVSSITVVADLDSVATCLLDRSAYANEPAVSDGSAISAHAGYDRYYDGTNSPSELSFHTLPRITSAPTTVAGADTTNGAHFFAVQWEWDDANGIRHRSAPFFFPGPQTLGGAAIAYNVPIEPLTHTERTGVRAVFWVTAAGLTTYYRAFETAAPGPSAVVAGVVFGILDSELQTREVLDQGGVPSTQGLIPAERARATDFIVRAGDRLHSRDPLQGKIQRFSIPSREASGFGMHWPLAFAVEEPDERDVTGVLEMDGRILVGSKLGLAMLTADGPDATGAGSFGTPTILRAEIGIDDQAQLARTPIGYAFGTRNGEPKLLTPGLTVEDLAKQVERAYKIDGTNIVSIAFDQNREEMVFLANAGKTLRLNTSTGRWGSDPNRLGRDLTVTKDGTLYLIRSDGKVLKQREDVWADGGVGYALKVSTPWIRDMARDGTTHSSFRLNAVYVSGEYLGPHDLFFDVYKDFDDTTPWGTFQVPEATVVANAAANRGWIYGVRLGGRDSFLAARIVVRDGAEPNRTFRLAQMDIDILTDKNSAYAELPSTHYATQV